MLKQQSKALKALEKSPDRRYRTAGELGDEIERHLQGRPVLATRAGLGARAWRLAWRHKAAVLVTWLFLTVTAVAAYALIFPTALPLGIGGDWWDEKVPFDELRWRGEVPEVQLDGRWFELVEIDGLNASFIVGFCKQMEQDDWRNRFSEDLLEVLNRMGNWCIWSVDLELRELDTGRPLRLNDVPLDHDRRQVIRNRRNEWPFESLRPYEGRLELEFDGSRWELVSVDGLSAARLLELPEFRNLVRASERWEAREAAGPALPPGIRRRLLDLGDDRLYDLYCELVGRSPGETIDLELRDPATGEVRRFEGVERATTPVIRSSLAELGER